MAKRWLTVIVVLILGALAAFLALRKPAPAPEQTPLTLMLDWFPNADHVPLYVAQQKGWFEQAGLQFTFQVPAATADPLKLAAAGQVDLAINYQPEVVIARSEGLPVVSIGVLVEHPLTTVLFLKDSGIEKPQDLSGRTIGYAVPHLQEILFKAFAEKNGITDYRLQNVGFDITPALLTHRVDAVIGAYRNYEKNELELEGHPAGFFPLEQYGIPDFYELVVITSEATLKAKRPALRAFVETLQRAIDYCRAQPDSALALYFAANPDVRKDLDRKAFFDTLPLYAHSQVQDPDRWNTFVDFALEYGLIQKRPTPPLFVNLVEAQP